MFDLVLQTLLRFLVDNDAEPLLRESAQSGSLVDLSRKRLLNKCTQFTVSLFGHKPSVAQRRLVARAINEIFPFLPIVSRHFSPGNEMLISITSPFALDSFRTCWYTPEEVICAVDSNITAVN